MLLEVKDLTTYFFIGAGVVRAVDGGSYDVREGETVALVGEAGGGKTVSALSGRGLRAPPARRPAPPPPPPARAPALGAAPGRAAEVQAQSHRGSAARSDAAPGGVRVFA